MTNFSIDEDFAHQLDAEDSLRPFREKLHLPLGKNGKPLTYLAGNLLGLMPKAAREIVEQELDDRADLVVDGHINGRASWYSYQEPLHDLIARLLRATSARVLSMYR